VTVDCTITIKAKGNLKKDWTGPVRDATKDWDIFYRAVYNHVKDCDKCDPTQVLQKYWDNRQRPKFNGALSVGLAALALRYYRIGADANLVKKFISDPDYVDYVLQAHELFSDKEIYDLAKETWLCGEQPYNYWLEKKLKRLEGSFKKKNRPFINTLLVFVKNEVPLPPYEDMETTAAVIEVTTS
jgi:hypothetical protein